MADPDQVIKPTVDRPPADYTPQARANLADFEKNFKANEEADQFCALNGMPYNMTARARDYLTDIFQAEARVTLLFEYMDNFRVIYLDGRKKPENYPPTDNGFSTGRWEGSVLVVETTGLKARTLGFEQRSEDAKITERWSLKPDPVHGKVLVVDLVVDDPAMFVRPMPGRQVFKPAKPEAFLMGYGCGDRLWDEFVAKRRAEIAAREAATPQR